MKRSFCILGLIAAAFTGTDALAQSEPQCIVLRPNNTHNNLRVVQNVPEAGTTAALLSFSTLGIAWAARRLKRG